MQNNHDTKASPEHDSRRSYLLIDRFNGAVKARIDATPETIEMLNKPQWMRSKGWIYELETQSRFSFGDK